MYTDSQAAISHCGAMSTLQACAIFLIPSDLGVLLWICDTHVDGIMLTGEWQILPIKDIYRPSQVNHALNESVESIN